MMGCLHILLADRFNAELQEIYLKVLRYLLTSIGQIYDETNDKSALHVRIENHYGGKGRRPIKLSYAKCLKYPTGEMDDCNEEDHKELFEKLNDFAEKYK